MAKRLFIAFVILAAASVALWLMPPSWGLLSLRWWVPLLGFLIVMLGVVIPAIAQARPKEKPQEDPLALTPDPGPSPEDIKRFGDPWLKLTDRE